MSRPKILITGINGKIGQAIVRAKSDAWDIVGIDVSPGLNTQAADISDWEQVDRAFTAIGPVDAVVHLAAVASSRALWDDVLKNNVIGTRYIYERAKNAGVPRMVFASSWHVVGGYEHDLETKPHLMVSVRDPLRPDSDYATSKLFGEAIARQYWELHGMRSVCLRIGNVEANDRPRDEFAKRIWLSHRDLVQLVAAGVSDPPEFGIYFATSRNSNRFLDLSDTERELGYRSQDDSAA